MSLRDFKTASGFALIKELIQQVKIGVPRSQLRRLTDLTGINVAASLCVTLCVLILTFSQITLPWMYVWAATQALLLTLMFVGTRNSVKRWNKSGFPERLYSISRPIIWSSLCGMSWGALTLLFPSVPPSLKVTLVLAIAGMAAGATTTLASIPQAALAFIVGCMLPPATYHLLSADPSDQVLGIAISVFLVSMVGTTIVVHIGLRRQIRAESHAKELVETGLQQRIASRVNEAETVNEALQFCVDEVCRHTGWPAGHVFLVSQDGSGDLVSSGVVYVGDLKDSDHLQDLTLNMRVEKGTGLPGRVLEDGKPLWMASDGTSENLPAEFESGWPTSGFLRAEAFVALGLSAYIGFPVNIGHETVAVLEFASQEARRPSTQLMDLLATVATQLGRAIERERAESSLRRSEEKFRRLIEASAQGMVVHLHNRFLYVNPVATRIFGYSEAEFLKLGSVFDLVHPDYHDKMQALAAARMAGDLESSGYDFVGIHKDGHRITLHCRAGSIQWGDQKALLMTAIDITERVKAEEIARREEKRAKDYLDIAGTIIYATDTAANLTLLNHAGERVFGLSQADTIGRNVIELFVPESDRNDTARAYAELMAGTAPTNDHFVKRMLNVDGDSVYVRWHIVLLRDHSGAVTGVLGSGQDISQQKKVEEQLRQAQKMEAVGQLTSGIAHDFNNILMVIMGNLELASDQVKQQDDPSRYLTAAIQSAQAGADLNRQLLTFSRQENFAQKVVDINDILSGMSGLLRRTLGEDVAIEADLCQQPCYARVDPAQLESAVLNLALNARDATRDGGSIALCSGIQEGATGKDQQFVYVLLRDNGTGMTSDVLQRAPEPFFTTKEIGSGSGLGLSMVFGFAQRSGGFLSIDSTLGEGSEVRVVLPQCSPETEIAEDQRADAPGEQISAGKILLVEDQKEVADTICSHLSDLGYDVVSCGDGDSALALLQEAQEEIDLVLSDITLPGNTNGMRIARTVLEEHPGKGIVLMSGNPDQSISDGANALPAVPFLRKPFRRSELAGVLDAGFARRK